MNKQLFIVLLFGAISLPMKSNAQTPAAPYGQPSQLIGAFLKTLSEPNDSIRSSRLEEILAAEGRMNATLQFGPSSARQQIGSGEDFLQDAKAFYTKHLINYQEIERSIDYYQDLATVHSTVLQRIEDKVSKEAYEQWLWIIFDLAYMNDRWYITAASWVNAFDGVPIQDAMLQDTLWHQPEE